MTQTEQERVTQADIDFVNEFWRLSINWGSMEDMRELASNFRLAAQAAQRERDAVRLEAVGLTDAADYIRSEQ